MSKRYTYSRMIVTDEGAETFTAEEFDSFDEAKKAVDRGIYDRKLELGKQFNDEVGEVPDTPLKHPVIHVAQNKAPLNINENKS